MKILLACIDANGLAGSELFHYELLREFSLLQHDVTLLTCNKIQSHTTTRQKISLLNVKQLDQDTFNPNEKYDIILASQPETNKYIIDTIKNNTPIISVIHSEIRHEDPILHPNIKHYVAIRPPILELLKDEYKVSDDKISLIYNPIDQSRFNNNDINLLSKYTGIFVGQVLDPIRFPTVKHLVDSCIKEDWDLWLVSDSYYNFNHPNIKYFNMKWDIEPLLKQCHFTAGILLGRTTLEGWCCGKAGYVYLIDVNGNIKDIQTEQPDDIVKLCDSRYVAEQYIELFNKFI